MRVIREVLFWIFVVVASVVLIGALSYVIWAAMSIGNMIIDILMGCK